MFCHGKDAKIETSRFWGFLWRSRSISLGWHFILASHLRFGACSKPWINSGGISNRSISTAIRCTKIAENQLWWLGTGWSQFARRNFKKVLRNIDWCSQNLNNGVQAASVAVVGESTATWITMLRWFIESVCGDPKWPREQRKPNRVLLKGSILIEGLEVGCMLVGLHPLSLTWNWLNFSHILRDYLAVVHATTSIEKFDRFQLRKLRARCCPLVVEPTPRNPQVERE